MRAIVACPIILRCGLRDVRTITWSILPRPPASRTSNVSDDHDLTFDLVKNAILKSFDQFRTHLPIVDNRRQSRPLLNCRNRSLYRGGHDRRCNWVVFRDYA